MLLFSNIMNAQTIDTKHLFLDLKFDWQKKQAFGFAEIELMVLNPTSKIQLDAGMLEIYSVSLQGKSLEFNYSTNPLLEKLEISLDREYKTNETLLLKINYNTKHENRADPNAIWGSFGKGLRFQGPTTTTPNKLKQIWSSGEPNNNKYWFPCNEDIMDIHTTEIKATVEKSLMVISNGNLIETIENDDDTHTFHYMSEKPFPNYLIAIAVGSYIDVLQHSNEILIHNYGYEHEKDAVKATTVLLPDMVQFMEEKTGFKYPFKQYAQVMIQDYPFPGLVGQNGFALMSDNYIDDFGVHEDFKYLWDGIAMQALANQWFGNLLMPKSWDDIWLNNAFAQYFAGLYTEKENSKDEYLTYIYPFEKGSVLSDWNNQNRHPITTNSFDDLSLFSSDSYSKYRGALVLRILQKEVGDLNWWSAIRKYVSNNANKQVSTTDFQKAIETQTGASYQWFFDQWIYKIGMPNFVVKQEYDVERKQLQIHVLQENIMDSTTIYEQVKFFQGKLDIEIDQKIFNIFIAPKAENIYTFPMEKAPQFINFNVSDNFLCEFEFKKSIDAYLQQLIKSNDVVAKQKAMDKLVEIAKDSTTSKAIKRKIETAFIGEVKSKAYWRYRQYALGSLRKIIELPYDKNIVSMLLKMIKNEKSWLKTSAVFTLGNTKELKYFEVYKAALSDKSDRVVNAAAIAIGKTKSPEALALLLDLENKSSWKSQNRISALNGLEQLKDTSAVNFVLKCLSDNKSPRWYLATPIWDYPFAAVNTLIALEAADLGFPILFERFKNSLKEDDLNDIFQNVQLIDLLNDERGIEVYELLKMKFKSDLIILDIVKNYEEIFLESLKN